MKPLSDAGPLPCPRHAERTPFLQIALDCQPPGEWFFTCEEPNCWQGPIGTEAEALQAWNDLMGRASSASAGTETEKKALALLKVALESLEFAREADSGDPSENSEWQDCVKLCGDGWEKKAKRLLAALADAPATRKRGREKQ